MKKKTIIDQRYRTNIYPYNHVALQYLQIKRPLF